MLVCAAQIMSSGWCVEAVDQDGNDYSMVTYCGRVSPPLLCLCRESVVLCYFRLSSVTNRRMLLFSYWCFYSLNTGDTSAVAFFWRHLAGVFVLFLLPVLIPEVDHKRF